MKIIFLDFDGVMDTAYYDNYLYRMGLPSVDPFGIVFDPDCIRNLGRIIEATGAKIVVSSTWKDFMSYKDFLDMWEYRNLPGFVTDTTPSSKFNKCRGDQIDAWLKECPTDCEYVIIDDMDHSQFHEHQHKHLFVVNLYDGLNDFIADKVIEYFKNKSL